MPVAEGTGEKPKVVYVLGSHRSGSTVLGVALGNCEGVFFAGELSAWTAKRGIPSFGGGDAARFWEAVAKDVHDAADLLGPDTEQCMDRTSVLFRMHKWPRRRRVRSRYRCVQQDLFGAIARRAGVTHIVDNSHYPLRAKELQRLDGIDLYLLFLARDAQSVMASFDPRDKTSGSRPAVRAHSYLWATHLLALLVFLRHPQERRMFVRHEDFLADPHGVLRQILDRVGSSAAIPDLTALSTGSPLQGNRFLRESDIVALRGPAKAAPRSRVTAVVQFPWRLVLSRLRPAVTASRGPADKPGRASSH